MFPNVPLRPKHHFFTHYPYLIKKFGPIRHFWTLRFESKHRYFKNILRHSPNFKNILISLSERHQFLQSLHATQKRLFADVVIADEATPYVLHEEVDKRKFICKKALFRGVTYKSGMYICCNRNEYNDYILCLIENIIINGTYDDLYFIGKKVEIYFDKVKGVFDDKQISTPTVSKIGCQFKDLLNHEPLIVFKSSAKNLFYFKLKCLNILIYNISSSI